MKKVLIVIAACLFLLSGCLEVSAGLVYISCGTVCSACSADEYPFIHEAENFDDVKVELAMLKPEYVDDENFWRGYTIVSVREIADKDGFMNDFEQLRFTYPFGEPSYSIGYGEAICFTYPDGQTEIVTCDGCGLFTDRTMKEEIRVTDLMSYRDEFIALWTKWSQK